MIQIEMNTRTIKNITLSSSSVLVDLSIRSWTGKVLDRQVGEEVATAKSCKTTRVGNYQKNLLAGSVELDMVSKKSASIRMWFHMQTLPWADSGTRLLPAARLQDFLAQLGTLEQEYQDLVTAFQASYTSAIQAAQFTLGTMFRLEDYPDPADIPGKFQMRYSILPLPEAGDFRVDIGNTGLEDLRRRYESTQTQRIEDAMGEVRERMKAALGRVANQWREGGKIYESSVDACLELCNSMREFNLTRDPELDQMADEFNALLSGYDVKDLKKDTAVRAAAKQEIDSLMDKFSLV